MLYPLTLKAQKKLFKSLIIAAIVVLTGLSSMDILRHHFLLIPMRIAAILVFLYCLRLVERDIKKAAIIGILMYSTFLTAFILNYSKSIAVGIWIVNYAFIMSILVKRRYAVAAILLIFAVFISTQVNLLLKQEIDQHELIFRLTEVGTAVAVTVYIVHVYQRDLERFTRRFEKKAKKDDLTGLHRRSSLEEFLRLEFERAKRCDYNFTAIFLDLDNFKEINDTHGHLFGDVVLQDVAEQIKRNIRKSDFAARYGGDEFVIILPYTDKKGACKVAQKILNAIKENTPVTASAGIKEFENEESVQEFLHQLDQLCYLSKKSSKGQIKVNGGLPCTDSLTG